VSDLFFDRMARELIALFVEARKEKVQHELDEEVERISGQECDDAARTLSKAEFKRVAEEAMENIRKRKKKAPLESSSQGTMRVPAYA
jgi:DNA transposition AAA+ family ATPase